ncbi:MAG: chitobiase/beta-hexosaminidase C-terminal domain-containing protein [Candidatus ainarchaeum sp.]|nr:chitobiase/beta-hexosaminidase C-terminal domain-containing protein [Candidatus ainarchaeum sp.]MDD3976147.1 chitobiase/beta-hexosaminidase C-terminal domain-containing protein [Candidatus ainarchaeum sp.]
MNLKNKAGIIPLVTGVIITLISIIIAGIIISFASDYFGSLEDIQNYNNNKNNLEYINNVLNDLSSKGEGSYKLIDLDPTNIITFNQTENNITITQIVKNNNFYKKQDENKQIGNLNISKENMKLIFTLDLNNIVDLNNSIDITSTRQKVKFEVADDSSSSFKIAVNREDAVVSEEIQIILEDASPALSNVSSGTYYSEQTITLTSLTESSTIYYTLDGSTPTDSSTEYTTSFSLTETTTLKTITYKENYNPSEITTYTYTIDIPTEPTVYNQLLFSSEGNDTTDENLEISFSSISPGGVDTYIITDWRKDNSSMWLINTPFDKQVSGYTSGNIKSYTSYGTTYNGTLGAGYSTRTPTWTTTNCPLGGCYNFDGSDDYISFGNGSLYNNKYFTTCVYIRPDTVNKQQGLFGQYDNHGVYRYRVYLNSNNKIYFEVGCDYSSPECSSGWKTTIYSNKTISAGETAYVCVTYDEQYAKIYINGDLDKSQAETRHIGAGYLNYLGTNTYTPSVIKYSVSYTFDGILDEFLVKDTAYSAEQIKQMYTDLESGKHINSIASQETGSDEQWSVYLTPTDLTDEGTTKVTNNLYVDEILTPPLSNYPSATYFDSSIDVNLFTLRTGNTIYYTTDGSTPTDSSTEFTDLINISEDITLKAINYKGSLTPSSVSTFNYSFATLDLSNILLSSSSDTNTSSEDLNITYTINNPNSYTDVTVITDWKKNGNSIAVLNMPFDVNISNSNYKNVKDYSDNLNHATLGDGDSNNSPTWTNSSSCKVGGCYDFDGVNDTINIENESDFDFTNAFTLSAWIYPRDLTASKAIFRKDSAYILYLSTGLDLYNWADSTRLICDISNITVNTWQLVTATWDGTTKKIYVDGTLCNSLTDSTNFNTTDNDIRIGSSSTVGMNFDGLIDEALVLDFALTQDQITALYNAGVAGKHLETIDSSETTSGEEWSANLFVTTNQSSKSADESNSITILP